ncbi:MAG: hypothetical protein IMX05_09960 [Hydrogenibacillus schlegelii]|nr:hypothetical protein [Hydrogenibacillus schlegelii]
MLAYMLEVSDVDLFCTAEQMEELLRDLSARGVAYTAERSETSQIIRLGGAENITLEFRLREDGYKLLNRRLTFHDPVIAEIFRDFVVRYKGHATIKLYRSDTLYIHHVQYGEVVRITEVSGNQRKVLLDKKETVTMEKVMQMFLLNEIENRIPKLREAVDAELDRLREALAAGDAAGIRASKDRLKKLRREMLLYEI